MMLIIFSINGLGKWYFYNVNHYDEFKVDLATEIYLLFVDKSL